MPTKIQTRPARIDYHREHTIVEIINIRAAHQLEQYDQRQAAQRKIEAGALLAWHTAADALRINAQMLILSGSP